MRWARAQEGQCLEPLRLNTQQCSALQHIALHIVQCIAVMWVFTAQRILVKLRRGSCHVAVFGPDDLSLLQPLMR